MKISDIMKELCNKKNISVLELARQIDQNRRIFARN